MEKDVYERYLQLSQLRNLKLHLRIRNRNVRVGCIVSYYNISRRGLTRVAYLDEGAMRRPRRRDKREVVTPTSFNLNLKQKLNLGSSLGDIGKDEEVWFGGNSCSTFNRNL